MKPKLLTLAAYMFRLVTIPPLKRIHNGQPGTLEFVRSGIELGSTHFLQPGWGSVLFLGRPGFLQNPWRLPKGPTRAKKKWGEITNPYKLYKHGHYKLVIWGYVITPIVRGIMGAPTYSW